MVLDLEIRRAKVADIDGIFEVEKTCFKTSWTKKSFFNELEYNPDAHYFVAEFDSEIVGYIGIWEILDEGHITNVAVLPEFRRMGVGRSLVQKIIDFSRAGNMIKRCTLEVRVSNEPARNLYSEMGFVDAGIRPKYYIDNDEDAYIMWIEL